MWITPCYLVALLRCLKGLLKFCESCMYKTGSCLQRKEEDRQKHGLLTANYQKLTATLSDVANFPAALHIHKICFLSQTNTKRQDNFQLTSVINLVIRKTYSMQTKVVSTLRLTNMPIIIQLPNNGQRLAVLLRC